jgi:threonine/homoserine/homoserine lactone efflux protein
MKNNLSEDRNLLFKWACKGLKFFLLTLLGFAIACVISQVFGADTIVQMLLSPSVLEWLGRIAVFIFCSFAVAIIYESSR